MRILVSGPAGQTGRHVLEALSARNEDIALTGFSREPARREGPIEVVPGNAERAGHGGSIEVVPGNADRRARSGRSIEVVPGNAERANHDGSIEVVPGNAAQLSAKTRLIAGDMENPARRADALTGIDTVIHYGPANHPREAALGTGMIDAAIAAGATRFIYISAFGAGDAAIGAHRAKREVEAYLALSDLEWTILRPQTYMQNIEISQVVAHGTLLRPLPVDVPTTLLDIADLGEVAANVALGEHHARAAYDLVGGEMLTTTDMAAILSRVSGNKFGAGEVPAKDWLATLRGDGPAGRRALMDAHELLMREALGTSLGNPAMLSWLLGREPGTYEAYVRRCLS